MNTQYFKQPSQDTRVWHYMNTDKFVKLLTSSVLLLTRSDHFEDFHEGLPTDAEVLKEYSNYNEDEMKEGKFYTSLNRKDQFYVHCWHKNEGESYAMWKLYAGIREGVAIQTTYKKLSESVGSPQLNSGFLIGEVEYIDYDSPKPQ
jgi:hypothetical protein